MAVDDQQTPLACQFSEEKIAADILNVFRIGCYGYELHFCEVIEKQDDTYKHNILQIN